MTLPDLFETYAAPLLAAEQSLQPRWEVTSKGRGRRVTIPRQNDKGFDVVVQAETYGLYPFAGRWHGPAWDDPTANAEALCAAMLGFVRTLLCVDTELREHLAGGSPYRWELIYPTEQGRESHTTGLLVFNYFGKRTVRSLRNAHLPPRYGAGAV